MWSERHTTHMCTLYTCYSPVQPDHLFGFVYLFVAIGMRLGIAMYLCGSCTLRRSLAKHCIEREKSKRQIANKQKTTTHFCENIWLECNRKCFFQMLDLSRLLSVVCAWAMHRQSIFELAKIGHSHEISWMHFDWPDSFCFCNISFRSIRLIYVWIQIVCIDFCFLFGVSTATA